MDGKKQRQKKAALFLFMLLFFVYFVYAEDTAENPAETSSAYRENGSLYLGNPSGAEANPETHFDNFLMIKNGYALSYNKTKLIPNWVSWHLEEADLGGVKRKNDFRADPALPENWYAVRGGSERRLTHEAAESDYRFSVYGFDRGHLCPAGDRTKNGELNSETFLMTNMVPQSPKNNRHTWRLLEEACRSFAKNGKELYIICGPAGRGGTSQKGFFESIPAGESGFAIEVPAYTWKVVLVLECGNNDLLRINEQTSVIAVCIPNSEECTLPWYEYSLSVRELETLTGYDFFAELPDAVEEVLENKQYVHAERR
ncbi:DNA/RNA non-specific endonuclease [Treponema sp. OMZ 840]|uniref:DNA/RNA non-specific endonuclease n=1 Tax=Treponema sp. OMZ 840 TaxID=244313 RepID=UPI003D89D99C